MKAIFYISTVTMLLISCKKEFVHSDEAIDVTCECCDVADSIEGIYTGLYKEVEFLGLDGNNLPIFDIYDTVISITVEHDLTTEDYMTDSLFCKLSISNYFTETMTISSIHYPYFGNLPYDWSADIISDNSPQVYQRQRFNSDGEFEFYNEESYLNGQGGFTQYYTTRFIGYK